MTLFERLTGCYQANYGAERPRGQVKLTGVSFSDRLGSEEEAVFINEGVVVVVAVHVGVHFHV